jgi:hypothetical protein
MAVPLDAVATCVDDSNRCSDECGCGFSGYGSRLEALRHPTPGDPLVTLMTSDHVHPTEGHPHTLFRRQQVTGVDYPSVCSTCRQVTTNLWFVLAPWPGPAFSSRLEAVCQDHADHTAFTAAEATALFGVHIVWMTVGLSSYLLAREQTAPQPPSTPAHRCWCAGLTKMSARGGERVYSQHGLFYWSGGTTCQHCGTRWVRRDHGERGFVKAEAGTRPSSEPPPHAPVEH